MLKKIQTEDGECIASLKSEKEIDAMKKELRSSKSLPRTLRWLEAVKDPTRFQLIYLLYRYDMLCVCDLANIVEVSSSATSQHLRKLRDMDLVQVFLVKQTMFYRLKNKQFLLFFTKFLDEEGRHERIKTGS